MKVVAMPTLPRAAPTGLAPPRSFARRLLGRDWRIAWLFLLPLLINLVGLVTFPFVTGIILSFQRKVVGEVPTWVGVRNFGELLVGEQYPGLFWISVRVFASYTGVAVALKLVHGTAAE